MAGASAGGVEEDRFLLHAWAGSTDTAWRHSGKTEEFGSKARMSQARSIADLRCGPLMALSPGQLTLPMSRMPAVGPNRRQAIRGERPHRSFPPVLRIWLMRWRCKRGCSWRFIHTRARGWSA